MVLAGVSLGFAPDAWRLQCAEGELFWGQPQVSAGCRAQVEFGCHAAEIDHLACLNAGESYPDA